jgi:hypothetical protein
MSFVLPSIGLQTLNWETDPSFFAIVQDVLQSSQNTVAAVSLSVV